MLVRSALAGILRQLVVGIPIGVACAYALSRIITSKLLNAQAFDLWVYVAGVVVVVLIVTFASWLPAHKASKVDFRKLYASI